MASCEARRPRLGSLLAAILLLFCLSQAECKPPNFVVFLADDLGYGDIGCYGHPTILTPNVDELARNGMKFTQFYATYPICTPSRSGLLTGRLPVRNGIFTAEDYPLDMLFRVFLPISEGGLPADEVTIPQLLHQANYSSALIGKWHLGHAHSLPTQRGFDEFYGLPYSQDEGCPPYPCPPQQKTWPGVPLYSNETIIEQPVNLSTLTPRYNAKALDFIDRNKDKPFFLLMAYDEVHVPLFASNKFLNISSRGPYGDAAVEMDSSIGLIVQKLRDMELLDNTLVIFTSDNGAWTKEELNGGSNGLLRGEKGETWEGGLRIPTVFYWPEHIASGQVSLALGSHLDFLATFAELAGVALPNKTLDSHSLVPVIFNKTTVSPRQVVFYYRARTIMAVRYGDYKAHYVTRSGWGLDPPEHHEPPILYHLGRDPSEQYPLNTDDYKELIQEINTIIEQHNQSVGSLPPSQLDLLDPTGKVAPCCNHATNCTCSQSPNATLADTRSSYKLIGL